MSSLPATSSPPASVSAPAKSRGLRRFALPAAVLVGVLVVSAALTAMTMLLRPAAVAPAAPFPLAQNPQFDATYAFPTAFAATDEEGHPVTHAVFDGRVTIVDFFFTSCTLACPTITAHASQLQYSLAGTGVRFLSLTLDPEHDTPDVMRQYARNAGADPTRWTFATAAPGVVRSILQNNFHYAVIDDPKLMVKTPTGGTMANIQHPVLLFLVGPKGELLDKYNVNDPEDMVALENRARAAAAALTKKGSQL